MAFYLYSMLVVAIVAVSVNNCYGLTDEQKAAVTEKLKAHLAVCGPQYGVTLEQVKEWKENKSVPDESQKCFHACMFKQIGLLDDKGIFSENVALEKVSQYLSGDKLELGKEAVKTCAAVNEQSVSDGEAGCDRALLLAKCLHEQKEQLPFSA